MQVKTGQPTQMSFSAFKDLPRRLSTCGVEQAGDGVLGSQPIVEVDSLSALKHMKFDPSALQHLQSL